jgi:hypothetical protein
MATPPGAPKSGRRRRGGVGAAYMADKHRHPVALNAEERRKIAEKVEDGRAARAADGNPLAPGRWRLE